MTHAAAWRKTLLFLLLAVLVVLPTSPPYRAESIQGKVHRYAFDIVGWEINGFLRLGSDATGDESRLGAQISQVLSDQNLDARWGPARFLFPPLSFQKTELPYLLIVSPRDRIELLDTILLDPQLNDSQITEIEGNVERLGYSAEIERVGGVALYPSMVGKNETSKSALSTIAHEWFHQYLFFHALGRKYWSSYDMTTINETVAELAGSEIGDLAYQRFYRTEYELTPAPGADQPADRFDFNSEMHLVRLSVDALLAGRDITGAEEFMNERREYFQRHGYIIRKLNQAYFAFHGSYGSDPASINPLQEAVGQLRSKSVSLADFIKTVSSVSSPDDLQRLLSEP